MTSPHVRRLPVTLPLHSRGNMDLRWRAGGMLVPARPPTFPDVFAEVSDVLEALGMTGLNHQVWDQWPVAADGEGLWTDLRWGAFHGTMGRFPHPSLLQNLTDGHVEWDLLCPVLDGNHSLLGQVLSAYGDRVGATPGVRGNCPDPLMLEFPSESLLGSLQDPQEARRFRDRRLTLVDIALQHQQWPLAEKAWQLGVRWSDEALAKGKPLEALIVRWRMLRKPLGEMPKVDASIDMEAWLDTWLRRLEETEGVRPYEAYLDWRWKEMQDGNTNDIPGYMDSPASMFVRYLFDRRAHGEREDANDTSMPLHAQKMLDRWLSFWVRQSVDLLAVNVPVSPVAEAAVSFESYWSWLKVGPWLRKRLLEMGLDAAQQPSRKARL